MLLKHLELSGFKSFARKTDFSFSSQVSAIVGPNGSGKSNIAEAIRFVLGEQSMKSLRSKRGEDLIWNGSPSVPRSNRAYAAIVFDNSKRALDIDFDEVEIKRVIHRDTSSQYLVNGSPVRLKDVIELLSGIHIGTSSHHIISQGETDRILFASEKERRAMVEDALGLKIFQYKRAESERKLTKTRENIVQVEALRKEIAPHLTFLQKQMEKVQRAEEMEHELKGLYREYLLEEHAHITSAKEKLQREITPLREELARTEQEIRQKESLLKAVEAPKEKTKELQAIEQELAGIREKKDDYSRMLGRLEGKIEYARQEHEKDNTEDEGAVIIERKHFTDFFSRVTNSLEELSSYEDIARIREVLKKIHEEISIFQNEFATVSAKRAGTESVFSAIVEFESELRDIDRKLEGMKDKEAIVREKALAIREDITDEQGELREHEHSLFAARSRKSELGGLLERLSMQSERLTEEENAYKQTKTDAVLQVGRDVLTFEYERKMTNDAEEPKEEQREEQKKRRWKIERIKIKIDEIGGGGDDIKKEYEEVMERDRYFSSELEDLEKSAGALDELIAELASKINSDFKDGIKKINTEFGKLFSLMFDGGSAKIEIVAPTPKKRHSMDEIPILEETGESLDTPQDKEQEEGIRISLNIPSKKIRALEALSGGERSLTSIALIFAIALVNPPPFILLDETDAALDEVNSRKFGDIVEKLSAKTQFIVITHNRETMTRAGILYGITAGADGISRVLSVKLDEAEEIAE